MRTPSKAMIPWIMGLMIGTGFVASAADLPLTTEPGAGGASELAWQADSKATVRLQAPTFTARNGDKTLEVKVATEAPQFEPDLVRWSQLITVVDGGKTYRADYVTVIVPATAGDRSELQLKGELQPIEPLPFDLTVKVAGSSKDVKTEALLPLREGKLLRAPLPQGKALEIFWPLGTGVTFTGKQLAVPLLGLSQGNNGQVLSIGTDPYFGFQFKVSGGETAIFDLTSGFRGTLKPVEKETRIVNLAWHRSKDDLANLDQMFKTFYQGMPDILPGPAWIREIQLNHYDNCAMGGTALEADLDELTRRIPEQYRKHVIVTLQGYYDYLGRYMFNPKTRKLDESWDAYDDAGRKLPMTKAELHRRIKMVKDRGFRCGIYYCDSLAYDNDIPDLNKDWLWRGPDGTEGGWYYWQKRPRAKIEVPHKNLMLNPGHPEVQQWFLDYTKALIEEYGKDLDAFVWDETDIFPTKGRPPLPMLLKVGNHLVEPEMAFMRMLADITRLVQKEGWKVNPNLAFLLSDLVNEAPDRRPFCIVSHGTYQDSACAPVRWPYGLFPNYRNCLISCNWWPVKNRDYNRVAVEQYGLPQGVSNGYGGENLGPAKMPVEILDEIMDRFMKRVENLNTQRPVHGIETVLKK